MAIGRVMFGNDFRSTFGKGDLFVVNRGSDHGVTLGARFVVYRDKRVPENFLYELGEAVATATRLGGELTDKVSELARAVEYLDAAEHTVEERTQWAQRNGVFHLLASRHAAGQQGSVSEPGGVVRAP